MEIRQALFIKELGMFFLFFVRYPYVACSAVSEE